MKRHKKGQSPPLQGAGQCQNQNQGRSTPILPHSAPGVKLEPIPVASGGPCHWAICDSLFTLKAELEARGLDCPYDAIYAAWLTMGEAQYLPKKARRLWPDLGEVIE